MNNPLLPFVGNNPIVDFLAGFVGFVFLGFFLWDKIKSYKDRDSQSTEEALVGLLEGKGLDERTRKIVQERLNFLRLKSGLGVDVDEIKMPLFLDAYEKTGETISLRTYKRTAKFLLKKNNSMTMQIPRDFVVSSWVSMGTSVLCILLSMFLFVFGFTSLFAGDSIEVKAFYLVLAGLFYLFASVFLAWDSQPYWQAKKIEKALEGN